MFLLGLVMVFMKCTVKVHEMNVLFLRKEVHYLSWLLLICVLVLLIIWLVLSGRSNFILMLGLC